mgnify:CR=1 FL=1
MGFAAPWFLVAAAAVGLPLWLHLLRRSRSEPRPFASVMFWEARTESSAHQRRLQFYLLLALRSAIILLLALAFAQPYFETTGVAAGGRRVVLALDVSASMREGGRMARAKSLAAAELRRAPDARVITLGRTGVVHDASALQGFQATAETGWLAELGRAVAALGGSEPLEVHVFSDFQKTAMPASFNDLRLPANATLLLHPVSDEAVPNWAVERAEAPARVFGADSAAVSVTVRGYGTQAGTRRVLLRLNGKDVAEREVSVPADGRASASFDLHGLPYGLNRCEARIEPGDSLAADDRYYFSIERAEPRPVLYIGDRKGAVYFRAALESAPGSPFRLREGSTEGEYAFVVVADAPPPGWVADYVRRGGAALFAFAGRQQVEALGELTPLYFGREGDRFQTVSWMDALHPVLRDANLWAGVRFYRVSRADGLRVLARLADGTPVLSEATIGAGRALVFGSSLDGVANDLPLHKAFVPFVLRAAGYLSGMGEATPQRVAGSAIELTPGVAVEILDPHGNRALPMSQARTAASFDAAEEGFYELRRARGRNELIAVNADRRESDLALAPRETLALWENSAAGAVQQGSARETRTRHDLWPWLIALAVAAALAESFVGSRYFGARRSETLGVEAVGKGAGA